MRLWVAAVALSFAPAASGWGQQLPAFADTVVITATGEEQPAASAAAASTVIDRDEIDASDEDTIADLLRRVTGATVLRSGGEGGVTSLFVRGTSSSQTLVLLDGVRLNSPFFGGYDWSLPLTAGIERIEVVRGPFSALYGADAIGGVVQLVPERGGDSRVRALLEGGSSTWGRAEVEAATRLGGADLNVSAAARNGSGSLANDDFAARTAMVDLSYPLADAGRVGILARFSHTSTEVPFSGALVTPQRNTAADEMTLALPARFAMGHAGDLEVTLDRVQHKAVFRDPDDPYGFAAEDTDASSMGARATYRASVGGQRLAAGGEWRQDEVTDASSYGVSLAGNTISTRSLFAQDELALTARVALLAGVRWDSASPWGSELSPRAVVSWRSGRWRTWCSYGSAFRAPSLGELYYPLSGNPALTPEHSRAGEVGMTWQADGGGARLQATAFSNRVTDLIDFDFASFRYANVARAAQDGVELSGASRIGARAWLAASLTWLDARDGLDQPLLRRPRWSGSATLSGPLAGAATAEASLIWVGNRADLDPVTLARVDQPGFLTAAAAVTVPVAPWARLRARAENLANRAYEEVRGYPAPGRRVFLGVELRSD
jgi:vitamin B12 transporter